jgi:uncharacterized protein YggE
MVEPDSVTLNCGLSIERDSKAEALGAAAATLELLTGQLLALGGQPFTLASGRHDLTWSAQSVTTSEQWDHDQQTGQKTRTGRIVAWVAISIVSRSFAQLDELADLLSGHEDISIHSTSWLVDADNPAWPQVRAAAIHAAIQKGRDYAAALDGSVLQVEQIADAGLLSGREGVAFSRASGAGSLGFSDSGSPSLDPVPQELVAAIDARLLASVGALGST